MRSKVLDVDPATLFPGFDSPFGELHAFRAFPQSPAERFVERDVAEEMFPLDLEGVVVIRGIRNFLPAGVKIDWAVDVRIPDRFRGGGERLNPAFAEADDGGTFGAVDLHGEQIVAADANGPGTVEMANNSVVQFESGVSGVI